MKAASAALAALLLVGCGQTPERSKQVFIENCMFAGGKPLDCTEAAKAVDWKKQ